MNHYEFLRTVIFWLQRFAHDIYEIDILDVFQLNRFLFVEDGSNLGQKVQFTNIFFVILLRL